MKNGFRPENNIFAAQDFKNPSSKYSPTYNWIWNGELSHEETDKQLEEFERLGIKSVCMVIEPKEFRPTRIPSLLSPDYLTKPYFEEYKYAVERAKEKGMNIWLYDEGGWPSGGACGKIMLKHPELAKRVLEVREVALKKGEIYKLSEGTISAYSGDEQVENGFVAKEDCVVLEYFEKIERFGVPGNPEIPDLTRKEATEHFIEMTHEQYKKHMEEHFGEDIYAVFSDEPRGPALVPFREELEKEFLKRNGYSIRKFLPYLLKRGEMPENAAKAKIAWFDLCAEYFCKNYLLAEKTWTNNNNMLFVGHLGGENTTYFGFDRCGYYNLMRALRCFDVPGVDAIWRQIYPVFTDAKVDYDITFNNGFYPRYASSAAMQTGSKYALTESFGVYGAGATFDDMRYVCNYQAVRGINVFNFFGISYSRRGFHMTGEMPLFTEKHACYKDLPAFNKFVERVAYLSSLGDRVSDTGYYMPINDCIVDGGWIDHPEKNTARDYEQIGNRLEDANILFDIIDDEVLKVSENTVKSGIVSMGRGVYKTIIIPPCKFMPQKSIDIINEFISSGGSVYIISDKEINGIKGAIYTTDVYSISKPLLDLNGDTEKVRLGVRTLDNGTLYLLFNESDKEKTFEIKTDKRLVRFYAENGKIILPKGYNITLKTGETAFFFEGEVDAENEVVLNNSADLNGEYTFARTDKFTIGDMDFILEEISEDEQKVNLGDWTYITGKDFSGSGIYKTSFKKPKDQGTVLIDLGEVHYSCEVFVNKKSKGVLIAKPYTLEIEAEELLEDNVLEVRVSNTPANEYESTKSFDKWGSWQLTGYHERQKIFHKDSLSGGLYGPVKLRY